VTFAQIQQMTKKSRVLEGIASSFSNAATVAAGAFSHFYPEWDDNATSYKYLPFDDVTIQNNSNADLTFSVNDNFDQSYLVGQKTVLTYNTTKIRNVRVKNISSATTCAIGEITVIFSKNGASSDTVSRGLMERFFPLLSPKGN